MDTSDSYEFINEDFGLDISIELMKRSFTAQGSGIDSMKATARTLLGASSIIVSLLATLNLINIQPKVEWIWLHYLILILAGIAYAIQMYQCIAVLSPITMKSPIKEDWDLLYKSFTDMSKIEIKRKQLDVYLRAIKENKPIVSKVRDRTTRASWLLMVVVALLVSLSLITRAPLP